MNKSEKIGNEMALEDMLGNMKMFFDGKKGLLDCMAAHTNICYNRVSSSAMDNFSDGYSKDTTMNLFRIVYRAAQGYEDAMSRLRIDLEIDDVNMTVRRVQ